MALVLTRRYGQTLDLVTATGERIKLKVELGRVAGEARLVIDAPQTVQVQRPERKRTRPVRP